MASGTAQPFDAGQYTLHRAEQLRVVVLQAMWNVHITNELTSGCVEVLRNAGLQNENITVLKVPGSFELIGGARMVLESLQPDAVVCLGCIIKGDTPHFEYISQAVTQGLTVLQTQTSVPIAFGVLTVLNVEQAEQRIGSAHGHKGKEAAQTALQMIALRQHLE